MCCFFNVRLFAARSTTISAVVLDDNACFALLACMQPFVDADHAVQSYFPERRWAIAIPTFLFILVLAVAGTFIGLVMIKSGKKAK